MTLGGLLLTCMGGAAPAVAADDPPTLTVTAPAESDKLLGPDVRIRATCVDDGGSCEISVRTSTEGPPLAVGIGALDTIVALPPGLCHLMILATDADVARPTAVVRSINVLSPRHSVSASYSGPILDITSDRALFVDASVTPNVVRLVDRATNTSEIIWTAQFDSSLNKYEFVSQGFLVSGALLETQFGGTGSCHLREWRGGTLSDRVTFVNGAAARCPIWDPC